MRVHDAGLLQPHRDGERTGPYTLSSGEDLHSTARRFNISPALLLKANPQITHPSLVGPGDTLQVPLAGDSGSTAASAPDDLAFGAMSQSTTDLPPVVVTPDPEPDPFPGPPDFPPGPWDPGPSDPGGPGGGGGPAPVTEAESLQELNELLGEEVADILDKAPTLREALESLFTEGWTVEIGTVSQADFEDEVIFISPSSTPEATISALAHEVGHALHGDQFDWSGLEAFVESGLVTEAEGAFANLQIREELAAQGIDIPILTSDLETTAELYNQAWTDFQDTDDRQQAIDALADIFRHHESNAAGQTYVEFYTDHYNNNQDPQPSPPGGGGGDPSPPTDPH